MDRDVLMPQMEERFREEFSKALKALEEAPDGHWIEDSEMAFRDAALTVQARCLRYDFKTTLRCSSKYGARPLVWPCAVGLRDDMDDDAHPSHRPESQSRNLRMTRVLFWPPKPKLFERAIRTSVFLDLFGT